MKKILVGLVAGLILVGIGSSGAWAGLGVTVSPTTWDIQYTAGGTESTATNYFGIDNTSNKYYETIKIKASDSANWTCAADPGENIFALDWYDGSIWNEFTTTEETMSEYLTHDDTTDPDMHTGLKFYFPTSSGSHPAQEISVTISAYGVSGYTYNTSGDIYYKCLGYGSNYVVDWSGEYDHVPIYSECGVSDLYGSDLTHTLSTTSSVSASTPGGTGQSYYTSYWLTDGLWLYPLNTIFTTTQWGATTYHSCRRVRGAHITCQLSNTTYLTFMVTEYETSNGWTARRYITRWWYYPTFLVLD